MNVAVWAQVATTVVSAIGGVVSVVAWIRAKSEREEATRQAKIATDSAATVASAAEQIAGVQTKQDQRQQLRQLAEDRAPWSITPINGAQADLINNADTAKYATTIKIYANDQRFSEENIRFVGPRRSARISNIDLSAEMKAVITWHLIEDESDEQPPQIITW
jgi:hypothetical protein